MSDIYDRNNYHPSVVPKRLKAEAKAAITEAVNLGWRAHVQSGHGVRLEPPAPTDPSRHILFSVGERDGAKDMASIRRKIHRYATKERA